VTGLRSRSLAPLVLLFLAALSCGSHQLKSVTLQPSSADAKNFTNGQVQFTAKGTFSDSSTPVTLTSKDVTWCIGEMTNVANPTAGVCIGNVSPFAVVDQNGLAQCTNAPVQGTGYILAGKATPPMNPDGGAQMTVFGSATLTCP